MFFAKVLAPYVVICLSQTLVYGANLGQWGATIRFPLVPVSAALLHHTGELLVWSAYSDNTDQVGKSGRTQTVVYTPSTGNISQYTITNTTHDMFCSGISLDFDGRVVVTGGGTANKTSIQSGTEANWIAGGAMNIARGYHASATVSDGRIFTIGGSWSGGYGGKNGEIFDPKTNKWSLLPGCPVAPMLTADTAGIYRQDNHGWLFGWKNGYVFQAGPAKAMNWYGTDNNGSQAAAGLRAQDTDSMNGNAVMYDAVAGKILTLGGSPNYNNSNATPNAHVITIGNPGVFPAVTKIGSMWSARAFANAVVLPDGKVFITGGQTYAVPFKDSDSIMTPELWDPSTLNFTKMANVSTPRNYHSVALLMPDATVFNGGGGLCGSCTTNHFDGQFYSPPYLFAADGKTPAARPVISLVSASTVRLGGKLTVVMNSAVSRFSLVRMDSTTHTVHTDQRRVPLTPRANGLTYRVTIPSDAGVAIPGYWMLFALNSAGVPSVAKMVQVTL